MKFLTVLSFFAVAAYTPVASGEKNEEKDSNLRGKSHENRFLTEGLSIPSQSRIVGGTNAADGAYPFFVNWGGCGASLVADDVIISAAHCRGQSSNQVAVGQSRRGFGSDGLSRRITRRISHPNYRDISINYDYMVMKLDRPVDTNIYPPIRLNSQRNIPINNAELTVIGFGALSEGGSTTPPKLQQVNVNYINSVTCNQRNSYNGDVKDSTMFCAGTGGGKDSCQGDSGGPIFTNTEPIEQVGIVSWGRGCAQRRYPGVYSRISGEYDWIKAQICALATTPPTYLCGNPVTPEPAIPEPDTPAPVSSAPVSSAPAFVFVTREPTVPITRSPTQSPTRPPTRSPTQSLTRSPTRAPVSEQNDDPLSNFLCLLFNLC